MRIWCTLDILVLNGFGGFYDILGGGSEEREVNRLRGAIVPYIAENLQPYIMRPPIRSCGD